MQRFGSAANLHVHAHVLVMDGVFVEADGGALTFHKLPAPSDLELQRLLATVRRRVLCHLRRQGWLDDTDLDTDVLAEREPVLAACYRGSLAWRVSELAQETGVSLGHVSNVKKALVDREWAVASADGFHIDRADDLLDAWRAVYEQPKPEFFYTALHGDAFQGAAREAFSECQKLRANAVFASFSAARWLAAFARTSTEFFFSDAAALHVLAGPLRLRPAAEGGNVVVMMPKDEGVFLDKVEVAPGVDCTSPVQTFLDLSIAGDRGRETADHLRRKGTQWPQ